MMTDVRYPYPSVPASWPTAGIVDARAFKVGASTIIHHLTHVSPMMVRGACGIVAHVDSETRGAYWASGYEPGDTDCPTCEAAR